LLKDGEDPKDLLDSFPRRLPDAVARSGTDAAGLKRLYAEVRDRWIREDALGWLSLSPLYPGAAETLNALPPETHCCIVTTKQERFVTQLLEHNGVRFAAERIFGLDRAMKKEAVLRRLMEQHPGRQIHFVEDRLATLKRLLAQADLKPLRLHLACWGYNTNAERREAEHLNIHLLTALSVAEIAYKAHAIDR
jgi:phosphoglycolate phosphatase-like HAD superfamily hydrolase